MSGGGCITCTVTTPGAACFGCGRVADAALPTPRRIRWSVTFDVPIRTSDADVRAILAAAFAQVDDARSEDDARIPTCVITETTEVLR